METNGIVSLIVAILTGVATAIPLIYKLISVTKQAIQEKNWDKLLDLLIGLMEDAEKKFADGQTRKEWVIAMVQTSAEYADYPIDTKQLSDLIDQLCEMTKKINPPVVKKV